MSQSFKTVYFPDHPASQPERKNIKIAFSEKDQNLFSFISTLSSEEIRKLIGYSQYYDLKKDSTSSPLTLNAFCINRIKNKFDSFQDNGAGNQGVYLDPLHSTFKGGKNEPLQNWYPFLEGYSPQFVYEIYNTFCNNASSIYDPFAGSGTTPISISKLGKTAYYSEINPLLQYLIQLKIEALSISTKNKNNILKTLNEYNQNLEYRIAHISPDQILFENYFQTFGKSKFFDERTFDDILKCRSLVDEIACFNPIASDFLCVAILKALIPSSFLRRAGDLRFKTKTELRKNNRILLTEVKNNLNGIIEDLSQLEQVSKLPLLISEDAKQLNRIPHLKIDGVITSPPYLNGTNYLRNTKVELWFLRCLKSSSDLKALRYKSITAGINDVTNGKGTIDCHSEVLKIVKKAEMNAYDIRIPRMIKYYFNDMSKVFDGIRNHLSNGSTIAIDIGDSTYNGVHVKTDCLLSNILQEMGYKLKKEVLLRQRLSRDRTPLKQVLLVFQYSSSRYKFYKNGKGTSQIWLKNWKNFKKELPHQHQPFAKRNWGHSLHSLCSYQGKMKPSLAFHLIKTFIPENSKILDPFAGVGTIPFEAALLGHNAYGFEISPTAYCISKAKVTRTQKRDCIDLINALENFIKSEKVDPFDKESASKINFNKNIKDYFESKTLNEILLARKFFREKKIKNNSYYLVLSCLLHILHGNRPYALSRRSHPITPFAPTGNFEYRPLIPRLTGKVFKSLDVDYPNNFKEGSIYFQDATKWWPYEINELDAIITSPPFFDSTRFHLTNWMRLWFSGWEREDFQSKPLAFVDERQKSNIKIYESIVRQAKERLKPGGLVIIHLGKSKKCNMGEELAKISKKWFNIADLFIESVSACESHGISDKGTVTDHQFLILH